MTIGKHAEGVRGRGWRRKFLGTPIVVWLLIAMMGTALALLISTKQTANEAFQAKAIGTVNIGNMETDGIIGSWADQVSIEPGDSKAQCFAVTLTSPQPGDALKMYGGTVSGALADHLRLRLVRFNDSSGMAAGLLPGAPSCAAGTQTTLFEDVTLNQFKTTYANYASGLELTSGRAYMWVVYLPPEADGTAIAGQTANFSVFFENQG